MEIAWHPKNTSERPWSNIFTVFQNVILSLSRTNRKLEKGLIKYVIVNEDHAEKLLFCILSLLSHELIFLPS